MPPLRWPKPQWAWWNEIACIRFRSFERMLENHWFRSPHKYYAQYIDGHRSPFVLWIVRPLWIFNDFTRMLYMQHELARRVCYSQFFLILSYTRRTFHPSDKYHQFSVRRCRHCRRHHHILNTHGQHSISVERINGHRINFVCEFASTNTTKWKTKSMEIFQPFTMTFCLH